MKIPKGDKVSVSQRAPNILYICIAIVSMNFMALEICLTRLLSVMLSYHYVYAVTSFALLGSGIGAFIAHCRGKKSVERDLYKEYDRLLSRISLSSLSIVFSVLVIIQLSKLTLTAIAVYGIVLCLPFVWMGMFMADIFRIYPSFSGKIYFSDLFGAATGCILVVLIMQSMEGTKSILVFSLLMALNSLIMALALKIDKKPRIISGIGVALILILLLFDSSKLLNLPMGTNIEKEIYDSVQIFNGEIHDTKWSAFGRTDLVKYEKDPGHMDIYLDGTAGSPMYRFNGNIEEPNVDVKELKNFPAYFPFQFLEDEGKEKVLIIGSGGGRDVLIALLAGAKDITAVEVNPDLVDIMQEYSWYNGGLYTTVENVNLVVGEGRSYIRSNDKNTYNVIMLTLPRTNTSRSREGYALTENYLFTTDSLKEYMGCLAPGGQLIVVANDDVEILRLLVLALSMYEEEGVAAEEVMDSICILGSSPNPVFILKNGSFDPKTMDHIYEAANEEKYRPQGSFFPCVSVVRRSMNPVLLDLSQGNIQLKHLIHMVRELGYDIKPVSDNDPFFYKLTSGLPDSMKTVLLISLCIIISLTVMLINSERRENPGKKYARSLKILLLFITVFSLLGIGYMIMEISLIQKFVFFLGKPVLSLTVVLFCVLLGSGLGSFLSNKIKSNNLRKSMSKASLAIFIMLLGYNFVVIPVFFHLFLEWKLIGRMVISLLALLPLSVAMGLPFPLAIRLFHLTDGKRLIPWMWGINAGSSVLGSVFAMSVAITFGYNQAVIISSICYLVIFIFNIREVDYDKNK